MKKTVLLFSTFLFALVLISQTAFAALGITGGSSSNDSNYAYYQFNYTGTPLNYRVYIEADGNARFGHPVAGIGADFVIENGNFYQYTSDDIKFLIGQTTLANTNGGVVQYSVNLSLLGTYYSYLTEIGYTIVFEVSDSTSTAQFKISQTYTKPTLPDAGKKVAWNKISNYACYYGNYIDKLKDLQVAIIESNNFTAAQMQNLKQAGVYSICYLSIGEDDQLNIGDGKGPGGYASYYIDNGSGQPAVNTNWNSYYVNAGNLTWQDLLINTRAKKLVDLGCDGIFMDTIDTIEIYPTTKTGMLSLIHNLHLKYPNLKLVANRGFSVVSNMASDISGLMFENFQSDYNFNTNTYYEYTAADKAYAIQVMQNNINSVRKTNYFPVFGLDYAAASSTAKIQQYYNSMWEYDMIPDVEDIQLSVLYPTYTPTTVRGSKANLPNAPWRY